jgi:hypothetical protein
VGEGIKMSAFARGFGSVLNVYGSSDKEDLSFEYNGKDLSSSSTADALHSDWCSLLGTSVEVDDDDEE